MLTKTAYFVVAAASLTAVQASPMPLPLPLPESLPAGNNATRNITVGNTTYFNQTNGGAAACSRGVTQWCGTPTRRSVGVSLLNGQNQDGTGSVADVQANQDDSSAVGVGVLDGAVNVGLGGSSSDGSSSSSGDSGSSSSGLGSIANVQAGQSGLGVNALNGAVTVGLGSSGSTSTAGSRRRSVTANVLNGPNQDGTGKVADIQTAQDGDSSVGVNALHNAVTVGLGGSSSSNGNGQIDNLGSIANVQAGQDGVNVDALDGAVNVGLGGSGSTSGKGGLGLPDISTQ